MGLPSLSGGVVAGNTTTLTSFIVASAGDVVVIVTTSGDVVTLKGSITGGTGNVQSAHATLNSSTQVSLGTADLVENDGSGHVVQFWLLKVVSGSAINVNAIVDTGFATGAGRRWSMWKITPPTPRHFDPAVMLARTCSGANTGGAGSGNITQNWSGSAVLNNRGAWVSSTSYAVNDEVSNGGQNYTCTTATSGTTAPGSDSDHWVVSAPEVLIAAAMTASGTVGAWDAAADGTTTTGAVNSSDGNHFAVAYDSSTAHRPDQATTVYVGPNAAKSCAAIVLQATVTRVAVGLAGEGGTGLSVGHERIAHPGTALETGTGLPVGSLHGHVAGLAQELDQAFPVAPHHSRTVGVATSSNVALVVPDAEAVQTADESAVAGAIASYKIAALRFGLSDPGHGPFTYYVLRAWALVANDGDIADIRLSLYDGTTLVQQESAWRSLSSVVAEYAFPITQPLHNWSLLRAHIDVRSPSVATVRVSQVEFELGNVIQTADEGDSASSVEPTNVVHHGAVAVGTAEETDVASPVTVVGPPSSGVPPQVIIIL